MDPLGAPEVVRAPTLPGPIFPFFSAALLFWGLDSREAQVLSLLLVYSHAVLNWTGMWQSLKQGHLPTSPGP